MQRIVGGLVLAAGLVSAAPAAPAAEVGVKEVGATTEDRQAELERRLAEVMAEVESQRAEIQDLKVRLHTGQEEGGIDAAVRRYLESEDGKKALGRGDSDFRAFWKDGLNFETPNKDFHLKVNGRIMQDWAWVDADPDVEAGTGPFMNATEFRRLRVEMTGSIYKNIYYANVLDFSGATHAFKDQYIGISDLPYVGRFQVGYFKEPFSLEEQTSSKYITFMERSLVNTFSPAHNSGFMIANSAMEGRATWALGTFSDTSGVGMGEIANNWAARVTGTPWVDKESNSLVHVGLSYSMRHPQSESARLRARPEIHVGPRVVDTGAFSVEDSSLLGLEAAYVRGPFSLQGEWARYEADHNPAAGPGEDPTFGGWSLSASYWLTGESRPYKKGSFGRVKPKNRFDGDGGSGAWEVALRYSSIDLDDGAITGGKAKDVTLGVNWHLNPSTRIMLNYVMSDVSDGLGGADGDVDTFMIRFQIDF